MKLRVEYPWKPPVCSHYKVFGHGYERCSTRVLTETEIKQRADMNGQRKETKVGNGNGGNDWQTVNGRKSFRNENVNSGFNGQRNRHGEGTSRGGFNGRGRGGFGGRGFGDQRLNRYENSKYVPVKNNNNEDGKYGKVSVQNDRGKNKVDADTDDSGLGSFIDVSSKKGSVGNGNNKKKEAFEKIPVQIRADSNEGMDKDVADDLSGNAQFMGKNGLGNTLRQTEVKNFLRNNRIYLCGIIETQLRKKLVNRVCNEVFGCWTWCTNSMDSPKGCRIAVGWDSNIIHAQLIAQSSQVMHFLIRCIKDGKQIYVSVVYGDNSPSIRCNLWKNLAEHSALVGDNLWVMLGDFNIILKIIENSNGVNVRTHGMKEFIECIESLEMEDINMCGMFYTWIQRMRNPKLGILKKLDRVIGNSHFIVAFPVSFANFMPYLSSDHCPASSILEKIILDVNFLWKEERVRLLVGSSRASTTPSYSPGLSTTPSYSPRRSMTQSYSLGPSTPPSYSPRPSRNAKRANCKLLIGKLQVLEATLEMYMHLEKHAIDLRALQ
nr:hypothetical protein [Tanacetum cinerariifolium]